MTTRRDFLLRAAGACLGCAGIAQAGPALAGAAPNRPGPAKPTAGGLLEGNPGWSLAFRHAHTGEQLSVTYRAERGYLPGSLHRINLLLRDWRTGDVEPIDPRLLDYLAALRRQMDSREPFLIISGYRSPATNARLAARSSGVANRSLHMEGRAIDVALPDRDLAALRAAALSLELGGVGYYPRSGFVHLDTGPVRSWT